MTLPSVQECVAALESHWPELLIVGAGSVLVLGLAGLAALSMRRASSSARHAVWLTGFVGVLLFPVLSAVVPGWRVLPRVGGGNGTARTVGISNEAGVSGFPESSGLGATSGSRPEKETIVKTLNVSSGSGSPGVSRRESSVASAPALGSSPAVRTAPVAPVAAARPFAWRVWLMLCWPVGVALVMGRVLLGHLSLWSLRRRCTRVTRGDAYDQLARLRGELGVRRRVELLSSPSRAMPMTWGFLRPRVLLPEQAEAWTAGRRRDVLLHELAHVKRWDCLTQLMAQTACALYWFNPLAWVASRRMQVERERACDDRVITSGAEPGAYARHLLQSVGLAPAVRLAGAAIAMARPSTLEERVRAIVNPEVSRSGLTARGGVAVVLLLVSAVIPAAALKAQQAPPDAPPAGRGSGLTGRTSGDRLAANPATRPATTRPGFGGRFGAREPLVLGEGPTCTFDATIYDLRLPVDQIGKLDAASLTKASEGVDGFEKALAALGNARPIYRADQSVRLAGDTLNISSQVPVVTSTSTGRNGQPIQSYQYMSVGALFNLAGKAGAGGGSDMDLNIQVAAVSDVLWAIDKGVNAPVMRTATLSHKGDFRPGKPFVLVSVDASSTDKDGKAVAYVARVVVGEPQAPAAR